MLRFEPFNDKGGGYLKFLPVLVGNGTLMSPPGDIFDQPLGKKLVQYRGNLSTIKGIM